MKKILSTATSIAFLLFAVACGASDEQGDDGKVLAATLRRPARPI